MSNPTTPFSWQMPTNTDLVTDLPADFEVFGQAVATSMQDLLGGTTGQVLAKASNADMDFVWSADAAGMTNPMTTTGDVIYSSPNSTPVRLGIGSTGNVLTVAGGVPTWAAPAAGGMTLINSGGTTLTGSSITISSIPATYIDLYLVVRNPLGSFDSGDFSMRLNSDTNNRYTENGGNTAGDATFPNSSWTIGTGADNATSNSLLTINIPDYANTTTWKMATTFSMTNNWSTPANFNAIRYMQFYNQTPAISSITLFPASGTWTSGTAYLYGVK